MDLHGWNCEGAWSSNRGDSANYQSKCPSPRNDKKRYWKISNSCWIWHMNDAMKTTCNTLKQGLQTHTPPAILMQQKLCQRNVSCIFYRPWLQRFRMKRGGLAQCSSTTSGTRETVLVSWTFFAGCFFFSIGFEHAVVVRALNNRLNHAKPELFQAFYLATSTKHPESGLRHNCLAGICRI